MTDIENLKSRIPKTERVAEDLYGIPCPNSLPVLFTVSNGILAPKHVAAMGPAVWEFLSLVDSQTDSSGRVLGGRPIRISEIAYRLGRAPRTVERNLKRLERAGYIRVKRCAYGRIITIANPKKSFRSAKSGRSEFIETRQTCPVDPSKLAETKKTGKDRERERAPTPGSFSCGHGDCPSPAWHKARLVAEAQGLGMLYKGLPARGAGLNRWLEGGKLLVDYHDETVEAATHWMLDRDPAKWRERHLLPQFVAEDLPLFERNQADPGKFGGLRSDAEAIYEAPEYWRPKWVNDRSDTEIGRAEVIEPL